MPARTLSVVDGVGHAEPRLEAILGRLGEPLGTPWYRRVRFASCGKSADASSLGRIAGQHNAVEAIAADDEPAGGSMTGAVAAL